MPGKKWTPEEEEIVRQEYGKTPMADLATRLGRTRDALSLRARLLGVGTKRPLNGRHDLRAAIFDLIRSGFSDQEIAERFGVSRENIRYHRTTAAIPGNQCHPRQAARKRNAGHRMQTKFPSNWRDKAQSAADTFARESGWPTGLRMREVQILNYLAGRGIPASRRDISDALEIAHVAESRAPRMQSRAGSGYLPHLISLGLVTRLKHMGARCRRGPTNRRGVAMDLFCLGPVALNILLERANEEGKHHDHRESTEADASGGRRGGTQD